MLDPISVGLIVLVGALGFAQGFVNSRARRQKHNLGESENQGTATGK